MNNEQALKQLGIEIPDGYEFVRYGKPQKDDNLINGHGDVVLSSSSYIQKYLIIKEKIETDCWYLVEDLINREQVLYLSENYYWQIQRGVCSMQSKFNTYTIIDKMEVVK